MKRYLPLILFLVLVLGGGLTIGFLTTPGEWFAELYMAFHSKKLKPTHPFTAEILTFPSHTISFRP